MKKILLFFILSLIFPIMGKAQPNLITQKINGISVTSYPYQSNRTNVCSVSRFAFLSSHEYQGLPVYAYEDFGGIKATDYPNDDCVILYKFTPTNGNYQLVALSIGKTEWNKQLLVTYTQSGELIDYLEVHISCAPKYFPKQWKIENTMKVTVYQLKPTSSTPIPFYSGFSSIHAQRIDTQYQIDATGHFIKGAVTNYSPKTYTKAYLEDKTKNIWNGGEYIE